MKVGLMMPIQGDRTASWPELLAYAQVAEAHGLDSVWVADHVIMRGFDESGIHECWTISTALAAATQRITIGQMVICASFRNPGLVAKMAAALEFVAPGRVILGVGAGWHDPEYEAFGWPTDHKVSRFEEWIEIVARLLHGERVTYTGKYMQVADCVLQPMPPNRIPILIAGKRPRMLGLTAKWADQWNTAWHGLSFDGVDEEFKAIDEALAAADRDSSSFERTVGVLIGDPDQPDSGTPATAPVTVEEIAEVLRGLEQRGTAHVIAWPSTPSLEAVERLAKATSLVRSGEATQSA